MWVRAYPDNQETLNRLDRYVRGFEAGVTFRYGDVCSEDYGMILTDVQIWNSPEPVYTSFSVPGRNGDLIQRDHCWRNVTVRYTFVIPTCFQDQYDAFLNAIVAQDGYQRIWDSINPDVYREGQLLTTIEPRLIVRNETGQFDLIISCKPQRYLESGKSAIHFDASPGSLDNWWQASQPLIKVYGTGAGKLYVGQYTVDIKALQGHINLDSETMTAYRTNGDGAAENANGDIFAPEFPLLRRGATMIKWDGGITAVDITPRWWKI